MTQTAVSRSADTAHHTLAPHEVVLLLLESDPQHGLSEGGEVPPEVRAPQV